MQIARELARVAKNTILGTLGMAGLMPRRRAPVTVDALDVLAYTTICAGRHARHQTKCSDLTFRRLIGVQMGTGISIRTLLAEKMDVAEFHLLNAVNLGFVIVLAGWVDTLPCAVAGDDLLAAGRHVGRRLGLWGWRSCGFSGVVHRRCNGSLCRQAIRIQG